MVFSDRTTDRGGSAHKGLGARPPQGGRVLFLHNEGVYFAGAETTLLYLLREARQSGSWYPSVAAVAGSKLAAGLPAEMERIWVSGSERLGLIKLIRQAKLLRAARREHPFDLVHAWAARDWELAVLLGWLTRCPVVGTLHDHPAAAFISAGRQRLMRGCANWGLDRLVCVSQAVKEACIQAGYAPRKLRVVHNGLPEDSRGRQEPSWSPVRLGFLGVLSERKGIHILFNLVEELFRQAPQPWELRVAGEPLTEADRAQMTARQARARNAPWWPRVQWLGWVHDPLEYLRQIDLLVFCSDQFDPFPTVLLEAGNAGIPVFAANVGGVAEMVREGQTGWLFDPRDVAGAAARLAGFLQHRQEWPEMGRRAHEQVGQVFSVQAMLANYAKVYAEVGSRR